MSTNFYQQELMDHYRRPKNKKSLDRPDFATRKDNPSCGDIVYLEGTIDNNIVINLGFSGKGCVISQATASIFQVLCPTLCLQHLCQQK